jgi:hypothetical protein
MVTAPLCFLLAVFGLVEVCPLEQAASAVTAAAHSTAPVAGHERRIRQACSGAGRKR